MGDFCVIELSKFFLYERFYENIQPYSRENKSEIHVLERDSFIFSSKSIKGLIEDLIQFKEDFDFSYSDSSRELFSEED